MCISLWNNLILLQNRIYGLTKFQEKVLEVIRTISFGCVLTYGDIAAIVADKLKKKKMSAQAIGGALAKNPICILIHCHRVMRKNLNLIGYAGD